MPLFFIEKLNSHCDDKSDSFIWGGRFVVLGELIVKFVFEFFESIAQKVVFVLKVSIECRPVDHRLCAKVDDADFFDRVLLHHVKKSVAEKFSCSYDSKIFFVCHICSLSYHLYHYATKTHNCQYISQVFD